mgnify:CR=1 FL=1
MKRSKVDWSNAVDVIEGPCVVCGKEVRFLVPDDRKDPVLLYHSTCDMMPQIREHLKTAHPPLMPAEHVISKPKPAAAPVAAVGAHARVSDGHDLRAAVPVDPREVSDEILSLLANADSIKGSMVIVSRQGIRRRRFPKIRR